MSHSDSFPQRAGTTRVISNTEIAPAVFSLVIDRQLDPEERGKEAHAVISAPLPGQFFMLRAYYSGVLLGRPISVYRSDEKTITFLILKKGKGTIELCNLRAEDQVTLVGPTGNCFRSPRELIAAGELPETEADRLRIAVIGGGIGIAPVAGFALGLPAGSFDFYAAFRSAPYGLDGITNRAAKVTITTEDGSTVQGMLPAVFNASQYDLVYACGPTPMLRYIKTACESVTPRGNSAHANLLPLAFLSLEEKMACGAGVCLGCTVRTIHGNRRCCVDGPVFNAREVLL